MKETERIASLMQSLYNGSPWIDVNLRDSLSGITAAEAARKLSPQMNSIWEILHHLIKWRQNVLKRIQGKVMTTPSHNYFEPVSDQSEKAWQKSLQLLEKSQHEWIWLLSNFSSADFKTIYPVNRLNYYEHIHGIIQHDAYHLGQINLLKKLIGAD